MEGPDEVWKTSQVLGHSPFGTAIRGGERSHGLITTSAARGCAYRGSLAATKVFAERPGQSVVRGQVLTVDKIE